MAAARIWPGCRCSVSELTGLWWRNATSGTTADASSAPDAARRVRATGARMYQGGSRRLTGRRRPVVFVEARGGLMTDNEFPAPQSGFVVTHFPVVSDQDRSREFYRRV